MRIGLSFIGAWVAVVAILVCPAYSAPQDAPRPIRSQAGESKARKPSGKPKPKGAQANKDTLPFPDPKLSPEQVITIVLNALKNNDKPTKDRGIQITFHFASPANKRVTGPLDRFKEMVKNPLYRPMLNFKSVQHGPIQTVGDEARQKITITSANGEKVMYLFVLTKQKSGQYAGCWMTDAVVREPLTNPPPQEIRWRERDQPVPW